MNEKVKGTSQVELYGEILDMFATPHSTLLACQVARYHTKS